MMRARPRIGERSEARRLGVLAAVGLLAATPLGCATPPEHLDARDFDAPRSAVWQAAVATLQDMGYRLGSTEEAPGVLIGERSYPEPSVLNLTADADRSVHARWWGMEATILVGVEARGNGRTRVSAGTRLMGRTNPSLPTPQHAEPTVMPLQSNGTIERDLLDHIGARLAPAGASSTSQ